jgi:ubiquinone/menaquinone biosynthesis C-methylase UbiE
LSLLLHELGHDVTGLDVSPRMLERARQKAGWGVRFVMGDAARPDLPPGSFDVVLCRHVLWALPDPGAALASWARLLALGGILCVVEGVWHTDAGLSAEQVRALLPSTLPWTRTRHLSSDSALWGRAVSDERFLVTARLE